MDHQVSAGPPHALLAVATLALLAAGSFHGVAPAGVLVVVLHGTDLVRLLLAGKPQNSSYAIRPATHRGTLRWHAVKLWWWWAMVRSGLWCTSPAHGTQLHGASPITLLPAGVSKALQTRQHLPDHNHSTPPGYPGPQP